MKTFEQFLTERLDQVGQVKNIIDKVVSNANANFDEDKPNQQDAIERALEEAGFSIEQLGRGFFGRVISGRGGREVVLKATRDKTYQHFAEQVFKYRLWEKNPYFPVIHYVSHHKASYDPQCFVLLESLQMDEAKFLAAQKETWETPESEFLAYQLAAESSDYMRILADQYYHLITIGNAVSLHSSDYPLLIKCMDMFFEKMGMNKKLFDNFLLTIHKIYPNERRSILDFKAANVGYRGDQMVFFDPVAVSEGARGSLGGQ